MMAPRQSIAYASPCFVAEEATNPAFIWRCAPPNDHWSGLLTCNIGLE